MKRDQQPGVVPQSLGLWAMPLTVNQLPIAMQAEVAHQQPYQELHYFLSCVYLRLFSLDQVRGATIASGVSPRAICNDLSAGYETEALARFTEALGLPKGSLSCWSREAYEAMAAEKMLAIVTEVFSQGDKEQRRGK